MWETDAQALAAAIGRDFPSDGTANVWWIGDQAPALRIIDCVLSLRRKYESVVIPRVKGFLESFPEIRSCADLAGLITEHSTPHEFARDALRLDSAGLGKRVQLVTQYLIESQVRFAGDTEVMRLHAWATWTRPGDHLAVGVHGFGLAGFQYLRMLFGADTAKPDVHIMRYVSGVLGRKVSDIHTLYILERAGEITCRSIRQLDNLIWQRGRTARKAKPVRPCVP